MEFKKSKSGPMAQQALVRPIPPSRPRASADHRVAHVEARPSRPTARDGGRPARDDSFMETPPNYLTFTASAKTLFTQSRLLQIRPSNFLSSPPMIPLWPPARTGPAGLAPATHAGHLRPPPPKPTSRLIPRREREV